MIAHHGIRTAFFLSGVAGLVYEVLWSRYLGLFVGHTAYAQVLVLGVYLGGMAVGSFTVADLSKRLGNPLRWYAGAEAVLAVFGFVFHPLFVLATDLSYDVVFPAVGSAATVGAMRWGVAGILILPQAIVLGATFPLMAAGLVRSDVERPGHGVAVAYLLNTLGGAFGVILAGFVFIGWFGLPGTSMAAAVVNLAAAGLVLSGERSLREEPEAARYDPPVSAGPTPESEELNAAGSGLTPVLLTVAFGTALASFAYEIGWIRMLALVLGSATHAFEIMLSAFILGIAAGAWLVRGPSDASRTPVRLLGLVQVAMGLTALASLPLYLETFRLTSAMVDALAGEPAGYELFNVGRYGVALLVMLPSTVLAGTTLPLITAALLRAGRGERTIGRVYGMNTIGSVAGAGIAGLIALPYLGLEGLITAGAALDVALGIWLLERSGQWLASGRAPALVATVGSLATVLAVGQMVAFTPETLTSGVYRKGELDRVEAWRSLFYADGRTATVSAHVTGEGLIVLATNGKPDASLAPRWLFDRRDTLPVRPIPQGQDFTTQVVAPAVTMAHHPGAGNGANIGHGSGMTAATLLTSSAIERLVTLEIEPLMVEGSFVFLPANGLAFSDPRASFVFDDAKSYFSYRRERFDLIFAEPSNPWVSGTASLFTEEFYDRITDFLTEDGVLGQWMQIYELDDELFLSVVAALDAVFPVYRAYLVGDADVAIVAALDEDIDDPDWSVVETEAFRALTMNTPPFLAQHMEPLFLFDQDVLRPVLDKGVKANSDYDPILDLGAERTRFDQSFAEGVYSLSTSRVNLQRYLTGEPLSPTPYRMPPASGWSPTMQNERGAWLREALESGGGIAPEEFPEWQNELVHLREFLGSDEPGDRPGGWQLWSRDFVQAENALHWGLEGWVDDRFYDGVFDIMEHWGTPALPRAVVDLMHGYALGNWERAAAAADRLIPPVSSGERWLSATVLMDIAVLAYRETGRRDAARLAIEQLATHTGRTEGDLRTRLLRALVDDTSPELRRPQ